MAHIDKVFQLETALLHHIVLLLDIVTMASHCSEAVL